MAATTPLPSSLLINTIDADVAGRGVVIGFALTSALTLLISIVIYRLRVHQARHEARTHSTSTATTSRRSATEFLAKYLAPKQQQTDPLRFWIKIIERLLLSLSDQQLLTGYLLLVLVYPRYWQHYRRDSQGDLMPGELLVAADLTFISSITHATTLISLRDYFRASFWMTAVRVLLTYVTFVLWANIALTEFHDDVNNFRSVVAWDAQERLSFQTQVHLKGAFETVEFLGLTWIYVGIAWSLLVPGEILHMRSLALFHRPKDSSVFEEWRESPVLPQQHFPLRILDSLFARLCKWFCRAYLNAKSATTRFLIWSLAEILFPWFINLPLLCLLFAIGLGNIAWDLQMTWDIAGWGFGQVLPMLLILLPIYSLLETYSDSCCKPETRSQSPLSLRNVSIRSQNGVAPSVLPIAHVATSTKAQPATSSAAEPATFPAAHLATPSATQTGTPSMTRPPRSPYHKPLIH